MEILLNLLATTYLSALEAGAHALAIYGLPILSVAAVIQFHRDWWPVVLSGGSQLGDALGHLLLLLVSIGFYMWLIIHLWDLGQALFDTFAQWGMLGSGNGLTSEQLRNPGFILTIGMKLAFPLAEQAAWYEKAWQYISLALSPKEWVMALAIGIAFLAIAGHHLFLLVEFYLALMCGHVLIGWGFWRTTAHFAEFSLGWITGSLIRAMVSCVMLGLSLPLFEQIRAPVVTGGAFDVLTYIQTATPVAASIIFAILCWVLPAKAARMAGGASLGLTGSTIASAAMTTTRFAMMSSGAIRGTSAMLRRVGA
jgi:P-type conjugative transfer protein TrbL